MEQEMQVIQPQPQDQQGAEAVAPEVPESVRAEPPSEPPALLDETMEEKVKKIPVPEGQAEYELDEKHAWPEAKRRKVLLDDVPLSIKQKFMGEPTVPQEVNYQDQRWDLNSYHYWA